MKISYLLPNIGVTGGSQVVYRFMDGLTQAGHEVHLVTPVGSLAWRPGMADAINSQSDQPPFDAVSKKVLIEQPWLDFAGMTAELTLEKYGPAAVCAAVVNGLVKHWVPSEITIATHNWTAYAAFHLMDKTIPLYHIQAYEELFYDEAFLQKTARLTYFMPIRLMSNCGWLKARLEEATGRSSRVLTPGIDTGVFLPYENPRKKFLSGGKVRVISYCSLKPHKGWRDAVAAMDAVVDKLGSDRVEWLVFGEKPDPLPKFPVSYRGKLFGEDLARLYSSAHICLMPSWFETFPLPPLEAMACGAAVVTTPIGTEEYANHEKNSLVVEPRRPREFAEAVLRLAENPEFALQMAQAGLATAAGHSWAHATANLEHILEAELKAGRDEVFTRFLRDYRTSGKPAAESSQDNARREAVSVGP